MRRRQLLLVATPRESPRLVFIYKNTRNLWVFLHFSGVAVLFYHIILVICYAFPLDRVIKGKLVGEFLINHRVI